jgi:iron complex transport system substrate-binding protein
MKRVIFLTILVTFFSFLPAAAEPASPKRIVSLAPSMTEILFALGLEDNIVGVTSYCDYPAAAKAKPKIGGMSNPSLEAIITLKPDLVVMTMDGNPKEVEARLRSLKITTYVFTARRIADLPHGYRQIGAALGVSGKAEQLAHEMEKALMSFGSRVHGHGAGNAKRKVLFIVWPEPLLVAGPGTVIDDAMGLIGVENMAAGATMAYPKYSLEEVIHQSPDALFIGSATGMDMRKVSKGFLKRLAGIPAVKNNAVCYTGDKLYRLGPRVVKGIEELAACLK